MNKIAVVGLGPGHPDYILPKALKVIEESDTIIGGRRHLESINTENKKTLNITGNLKSILDYIEENYRSEKIAVVVSGDTGYYSFLNYLKKHFETTNLEVIPGISSLQYMFSRIGESWHDGYLGSLHGREQDLINLVSKNKKIGLLTDKKWTPHTIAKELLEASIDKVRIYVGENLSYDNERVVQGTPEEIVKMSSFNMCVVVIIHEN